MDSRRVVDGPTPDRVDGAAVALVGAHVLRVTVRLLLVAAATGIGVALLVGGDDLASTVVLVGLTAVAGLMALRTDFVAAATGRAARWPLDVYPLLLAVLAALAVATRGPSVATSAGSVLVALVAGMVSGRRVTAAVVVAFAVAAAVDVARTGTDSIGSVVVALLFAAAGAWFGRVVTTAHLAAVEDQVAARRLAERRAADLSVVADVAASVDLVRTDPLLDALADAAEALGWERSALYVPAASGEGMAVAATRGLDVLYLERPRPGGVLDEVLRTGRTVVRHEYGSVPGHNPAQRDLRVAAGVPVAAGAGRVGAFVVGRLTPLDDDTQVRLLELLGAQAGRVVENARAFDSQLRVMSEIEQVATTKEEFVATVSHELRTPLHVVRGMAETVDARWHELEAGMRRDMVARLRTSATELTELVETLLDFTRLRAGGAAPDLEPVDLGRLVVRVVDRWRSDGLGHELRVDVDTAPRPVVAVDAGLLERAVDNLVSNALRHTPVGTTVDVTVSLDGPWVRTAVADDGPGIPTDSLPRLGERFYRGEEPHLRRVGGGVGIGLALTKEVLELHGTTLDIDSTVGRGTTCSFVLPVQPPRGRPPVGGGAVDGRRGASVAVRDAGVDVAVTGRDDR